MNADDVARYLKSNPGFFEQYADQLAQITVPHPHGGRAIPLSDRQMLALRDKNRVLEGKLTDLLQFGEENDTLTGRVHRLAISLLWAHGVDSCVSALYTSLRDDFQVPHVAIRLWRGSGETPEFKAVSAGLHEQVMNLTRPYCGMNPGGANPMLETDWFDVGPEHIRSVALIPLGPRSDVFGVLVLASEDAKRFYPEMGTLFLERVGELTTAAVARFV
jgi:uncharacterized protein